jgi:hypothetical protein
MKVLAVVVGVVLMGLVGCAGTKVNLGGYRDAVPDEIQNLVKKQYSDCLVAVGTGSSANERIAIDVATIDAKTNIASQFSSKMKALKQVYDEDNNNSNVGEYKSIMTELVNMEIKGAVRVKTMEMVSNNEYKTKVLVVLSADILKEEIEKQLRTYTSVKAEEFKKELFDRIKAENEKTNQ